MLEAARSKPADVILLARTMENFQPDPIVERRFPLGERILVLLIALAAFGYSLFRVLYPWEPWLEEAFWPRLGEAVCLGVFLLWAVGLLVGWPRFLRRRSRTSST
jgi:hypothetical protein